MPPFIPTRGQRWRLGALASIVIVVAAVVVRGRGNGPIPLAKVLKATTGEAFYHWKKGVRTGSLFIFPREGWCALRRSSTLVHLISEGGTGLDEERLSPSGIYRHSSTGRTTFESRSDVVGMEQGNDVVTQTAIRLSGRDAVLKPRGGNRWQGGEAIYTLDPSTTRILKIEAPDEILVVDYPLALSSDLFEAPR